MPQVSADGKTITVKLKPGLTWSDGKPLSAKDWVYGALRQLNPVVAGDYAFTLYGLEGAEKYNTADPKEIARRRPPEAAGCRRRLRAGRHDDCLQADRSRSLVPERSGDLEWPARSARI